MPRRDASKQLAILDRRKRVAQRYMQGETQGAIALAEYVNQATVSRDIAAVRAEWQEQSREFIATAVAVELARIDHLAAVSWAAWEESLRHGETTHMSVVNGRVDKDGKPLPDLSKAEKTVRGQTGDPRFLAQIAWCSEQRLKISGGYAPQKIAPTNPEGDKQFGQPVMTDEERMAKLDVIFSMARARKAAAEQAALSDQTQTATLEHQPQVVAPEPSIDAERPPEPPAGA